MSHVRAIALVMAVVVAPCLLYGIPSSRPIDSPSSELQVTDSSANELAYLAIDDRVLALEKMVAENHDQIAHFRDAVAACEGQLARAKQDQLELPKKINQLAEDLNKCDAEIPFAKDSLESARRAHSTFLATIDLRLKQTREAADVTRQSTFSLAMDRIAQERAKRNELRARLGAQREDQEEVYHTLAQKRRAQQQAEQGYLSELQRIQSKINEETSEFATRVSVAETRLSDLIAARIRANRETEVLQAALADAVVTIATTPDKVSALSAELAQAMQLRSSRESALRIARLEQRRRDEAYVEAQVREREAVQYAALNSSDVLRSAPRQEVEFVSNSASSWPPSQHLNNGPTFSARYYNPEYRPRPRIESVHGHFRSNGTYVSPYIRTSRDSSFGNNYSSKGNLNPYTGKMGSKSFPTGLRSRYR